MDEGEEIDWLRSKPREEARLGCQADKQGCDIFRSACSRCFYVLLDLVSCAAAGRAEILSYVKSTHGRISVLAKVLLKAESDGEYK